MPGGSGAWTPFVGLQLVLLVFFVFLVGSAPPDAVRTDATLASLRGTFAPQRRPDSEDAAVFVAGASMLAELGGDLAGRIRLARVASSRRADEVALIVPARELFAPGETVLRPETIALQDRIVAALSTPPPGYRLVLTLTLAVGDSDADPADALAEVPAQGRAAGFAAALLARGAPPHALAVGIGPGEAASARLVFRLSGQPAPLPDLAEQ